MSKLYRSRRDKMVTGLLGGLSETLGIDSTLARLIFVVSIFFTGGVMIFLYFIAALVVPKEYIPPYDPYGPGPGSGAAGYYGKGGEYANQGGFASYKEPQRDRFSSNRYQSSNGFEPKQDDLDSMMGDIEKKALKKEVEELRQKLSKYEKGDL
ncbi:PspC domain-containing protein [Paenibacillus sp. 453mf]|uniref:PspC domain-containing protein n=1 Tax=Paenibacillus sp. 453mf TaxID=1761874 RepID=UPI0008E8FC0F|nr:PspC domain-containing protein [Paenibacillus sp. 453mf]SFS92428.1 Phage shock protein PspC (stress-responsive transcriptional regulator) [Paenibacillus sp. 453mf]